MDEQEIENVILKHKQVKINSKQYDTINNAFEFLDNYQKGKVIYGINTGFGPMAQYRIEDKDLNDLQ
ncbi:MAG: aromatic amino acid lyase [Rikenellaceae bacterium]